MQLEIWHITGQSFHFGRHGLGQEESGVHFPSDSLFAALVSRLVELKGSDAVKPWIDQFIKDPPIFVLSSAFPRAGKIRFFPKPILPLTTEGSDRSIRLKDLKRVKYISEQVFRSLIDGISLTDAFQNSKSLHDGAVLYSAAESGVLPEALDSVDSHIWMIEPRPRVAIGRLDAKSNLFFTGRTVFSKDCGLWFAVRWFERSKKLESDLAMLLTDLGDAGLGGDRSSGFGSARIEPAGVIELPDAAGSSWITLSRYLPRREEINALLPGEAAYSIETVGGWVDSPVRKSERRRSINMLAEGSILGSAKRQVPGQIVDLQPVYGGAKPLGHEAWRSGLALAVGLKSRS